MSQNVLLNQILSDLNRIQGKTTPKVRAVAKAYMHHMDQMSLDDVIAFSRMLLDLKRFDTTIVAFAFLYRKKKSYTPDTFDAFEQIAYDYLTDWWDTDDFTTHAMGELIHKYPYLSHLLNTWTTHEKFAVRRAAATSLIIPIKRKNKAIMSPFEISNRLMHDPHYLVVKGYGWMLKVYMCYQKTEVISYLQAHEDVMPRLAFRYAVEKLSQAEKEKSFKK